MSKIPSGTESARPLRVKSGKAQSEHMLSGLPSIADIDRADRNVRKVPLADLLWGGGSGIDRLAVEHTRGHSSCLTRRSSRYREDSP
jgi:hypothetical protein